MDSNLIFTIGYGNRSIAAFAKILQSFDIQYLIDVRSKPYSKFNVNFNPEKLRFLLAEKGIIYAFLGDLLGGRPAAIACYDAVGNLDVEEVKKQPFFQQGLRRLKTAYDKKLKVVLMCCEADPSVCHRTKLVAESLENQGIKVAHIDQKGRLKSHQQIMSRVENTENRFDLFGRKV